MSDLAVGDVRDLDKKFGSYKSLTKTSPTLCKLRVCRRREVGSSWYFEAQEDLTY